MQSLKALALRRENQEMVSLAIVAGTAPRWGDPWARLQRAGVYQDPFRSWQLDLVNDRGYVIDDADIQLARLAELDRVLH